MKKILIIEDEVLIGQTLKKVIEKKGSFVELTPSGLRGIELIKSQSFDRIVCDLMLQDISGFDIIEEAKNLFDKDTFQKKLVIMTAYSSLHVQEKISQYGLHLLQKPFESLAQAIDLILEEERS
jgi:CheY-like chemotaxis protein